MTARSRAPRACRRPTCGARSRSHGDLAGDRRDRAGRRARGRSRRCGWRSAARWRRCSPAPRPTSPRRWSSTGPAAIEYKLDGARVQVHRDGRDVARLHPHARRRDRARARGRRGRARAARAQRCARRRGDRAARRTGARTRSRSPARASARGASARGDPAQRVLLRPAAPRRRGPARRAALGAGRGARRRSRRTTGSRTPSPTDADAAQATFDAALAAGHEGVMVKALDAPVCGRPARRGVAEGQARAHARPRRARRRVGPRPPPRPALQPAPRRARRRRLGDARQDLQGAHRRAAGVADRALPRARDRPRRPSSSTCAPSRSSRSRSTGSRPAARYPSGMALRFARVKRYRDDKTAAEADTVQTVRGLASG